MINSGYLDEKLSRSGSVGSDRLERLVGQLLLNTTVSIYVLFI